MSFFIATLFSVLDSIGDYSACARMCYVPQPPVWAVNRGIAVEGLMSMLSGSLGIGHSTVSYGGNIGAIGLTRVASRRVFQAVGLLYVILAILSKVGAVFITVPYSVLGGTQIITTGFFIGIVLSNLQYIDLGSTRNVAIIGISLLFGLMMPYWMENNSDGLQIGNEDVSRMIGILLANPVFCGGVLACFLDNTVPGTLQERGIGMGELNLEPDLETDSKLGEPDVGGAFEEGLEVYDLPFIPDRIQSSWIAKVIRIFPGEKTNEVDYSDSNLLKQSDSKRE